MSEFLKEFNGDFMTDLFGDVRLSSATISTCRLYRYQLTRTWDAKKQPAVFIMLNPSTADESQDDPTIRRCVGYAKAWGFGGLVVVNLYGLRATQPDLLDRAADPVGPDNDHWVAEALQNAGVVVAAWGATPAPGIARRVAAVAQLVLASGNRMMCLAMNQKGSPAHPLYQPANQPLMPFRNA